MTKKNKLKKICRNCLLFDGRNRLCGARIIVQGKKVQMPVDADDRCHWDELGIPVEQVRWFEEEGVVKIEYPEGYFGSTSSDL